MIRGRWPRRLVRRLTLVGATGGLSAYAGEPIPRSHLLLLASGVLLFLWMTWASGGPRRLRANAAFAFYVGLSLSSILIILLSPGRWWRRPRG
ncbi:protein of unknown function [Candidatus Hydrogenisulfobacillus filiaventi]|uniref:Uncharacterized protein n=1 Tax=Candidatus Hydrogenisulfobacillus filiaventi TaxID=2707344 RepID=A0A6F8ZDY4_9FIRM|nr:hypothetical protein [Bacillota bacterium]CAB1127853.1 protein of unknown function [Candidatus Hydrogenisulfobacillus filiaventi]